MPTFSVVKASNATFRPAYLPVAVFVGGTSGVGQGMTEAFARQVHGRAHIIIVGRNKQAAAEIIARFPKPSAGEGDGWIHEFIACNVSLMANVRTACAKIASKTQRINFLAITAGYSSMVDVRLTSEGLDLLLAMRYYYRYVCIQELLPLLTNAHDLGQDARVISVEVVARPAI
ncbi:hypothetical protein FB451DRAFT_1050540 [Mycena latifolia]|nr:hypothetical protein FB451DRAFT_1050540 [Mycena latifolia]